MRSPVTRQGKKLVICVRIRMPRATLTGMSFPLFHNFRYLGKDRPMRFLTLFVSRASCVNFSLIRERSWSCSCLRCCSKVTINHANRKILMTRAKPLAKGEPIIFCSGFLRQGLDLCVWVCIVVLFHFFF